MKIKKVTLEAPFHQYEELKVSIRGIYKLITRYRTAARRSNNPSFVIDRENKVEKLSLILADLNWIIQTQ